MSSGAKGFNFYEQWLGIECDARPDHYQLLGIEPFETDEQKIQVAFEVRRQRLQLIAPGEYAVQLRKLADEVIAAKRCLLTPAARLAYDEHLRFALNQSRSKQGENVGLNPASAAPAGTLVLPVNVRQAANLLAGNDDLSDVELPPVAGATSAFVPQARTNPAPAVQSASSALPNSFEPIGIPVVSSKRKRAIGRQRRHSQRGFFALLGVTGVVIVVGLVVLSNMQAEPVVQDQSKAVIKDLATETNQEKSSEAAASDQRPPPTPPAVESPSIRTVSSPPEQSAVVPQQPIGSLKADSSPSKNPPIRPDDWNLEFNRSLKQIRESLAQRNVVQAKEYFAACEQRVKWDEQREPLRLHQQLVRYTSDFWQAVSDGAAKLSGGEELEQNGKLFANVVESSATKLIVKVDGRNHRYTIPGNIDPAVAVAIARRAVSDPAEQAKLIGAFYAIDKAGDFSKAQQLWESTGDEMKPLLTLLKSVRNNGKRK
jgi:hypothetical protein